MGIVHRLSLDIFVVSHRPQLTKHFTDYKVLFASCFENIWVLKTLLRFTLPRLSQVCFQRELCLFASVFFMSLLIPFCHLVSDSDTAFM